MFWYDNYNKLRILVESQIVCPVALTDCHPSTREDQQELNRVLLVLFYLFIQELLGYPYVSKYY